MMKRVTSGPLTPEAITAARRDPLLAVLEGFHAVKHAIRFGADIEAMATPDPGALADLAARLAPDVAVALAAAEPVPPDRFAAMSPRPLPTPLLAVARRPPSDPAALLAAPGRVVLLDRPRHLGNLGAVVRVAAAAGAAGVLATGDRDPWDPAALRGSAGLHFALPVVQADPLPPIGRPLVAFDAEGDPLEPGTTPADAVLAFGSERSGLDPGIRTAADRLVAIPMRPGVSSLNLATAAAVALYSA
jgi:TrmH family RNA methyltransferase